MYVNVLLEGQLEKVVKRAVKAGYFKSATEAVRFGLVDLGERLNLLDDDRFDEGDARRAKDVLADIKSGKMKTMPEREFYKRIGVRPG